MCGLGGREQQVQEDLEGDQEGLAGIQRSTQVAPGDGWLQAVMEGPVGQFPPLGLCECSGSEDS